MELRTEIKQEFLAVINGIEFNHEGYIIQFSGYFRQSTPSSVLKSFPKTSWKN